VKVRFARPAQADLAAIRSYISRESPRAASIVVAAIIDRSNALGPRPFTGCPTDWEGVRVASLPRYRYVIFYIVARDEIRILHVRHTSRKPWSGPNAPA
jgi:plasmid stabilization system protein ParE